MRALITGGKGFVGRWLAEHLRACGDTVRVVDLEVDVTDEHAIAGVLEESSPDAIYHLAARSHVGASWSEPLEVLRVNAFGTAAVLLAARRVLPEATVLVVSSAEVYGRVHEGDLPLREDAPVRPSTPYAASKAAAEQVALQAYYGHAQRVVVVRPFNHVGPGQPPGFAVPGIARRILDAKRAGSRELVVGTVTTRRDFTDVRDVVRAYRCLAERGAPGSTYNVCSGVAVSIASVAERLMALAGVELQMVTDPSLLRPVDTPVLVGDASRLVHATGWAPEIPLDATLGAVLASVGAEPGGA